MSDKERNINVHAQIAMFLLFLLFLGLKLGGVITWSWLWVTAPLWGLLVFPVVILVFPVVILVFVIAVAPFVFPVVIPVFIIAVGLLVFAIVIPTIAYEWIRGKIK